MCKKKRKKEVSCVFILYLCTLENIIYLLLTA